jgi:predicted CXXCH cytochrome family protein
MKKLTMLLALGAMMALMPSVGKASIIGSAHDFSINTNWWINGTANWVVKYGSTNVCGECHTIHHAQNSANGPLFIHSPSANVSFNTYDQGNSPTYSGGVVKLGPGSLACLSCHDGSTAINSTTDSTGAIGTNGTAQVFITASYIVTQGANGAAGVPGAVGNNDLTHMHPIGFSYNTALAADSSVQPTSNPFNAPGSPTVGSVLKNGQVECSTCHDIHRTIGGSASSGIMTVASGQALCLGCHNK